LDFGVCCVKDIKGRKKKTIKEEAFAFVIEALPSF
jgi:hypothetical protein